MKTSWRASTGGWGPLTRSTSEAELGLGWPGLLLWWARDAPPAFHAAGWGLSADSSCSWRAMSAACMQGKWSSAAAGSVRSSCLLASASRLMAPCRTRATLNMLPAGYARAVAPPPQGPTLDHCRRPLPPKRLLLIQQGATARKWRLAAPGATCQPPCPPPPSPSPPPRPHPLSHQVTPRCRRAGGRGAQGAAGGRATRLQVKPHQGVNPPGPQRPGGLLLQPRQPAGGCQFGSVCFGDLGGRAHTRGAPWGWYCDAAVCRRGGGGGGGGGGKRGHALEVGTERSAQSKRQAGTCSRSRRRQSRHAGRSLSQARARRGALPLRANSLSPACAALAASPPQEAFKCYVRTRDYCTTPRHVLAMCLNVIRCAVEMGNFLHVANYVGKAEATPEVSVSSGFSWPPVQGPRQHCGAHACRRLRGHRAGGLRRRAAPRGSATLGRRRRELRRASLLGRPRSLTPARPPSSRQRRASRCWTSGNIARQRARWWRCPQSWAIPTARCGRRQGPGVGGPGRGAGCAASDRPAATSESGPFEAGSGARGSAAALFSWEDLSVVSFLGAACLWQRAWPTKAAPVMNLLGQPPRRLFASPFLLGRCSAPLMWRCTAACARSRRLTGQSCSLRSSAASASGSSLSCTRR
jgi:hypothetical protein